MELKKSPKADLQNKKGMFFQIGLIGALLFTICIFGWSKSEVKVQTLENTAVLVEDDIVEVTREAEPEKSAPRQALQVTSDIINIVKNDKTIKVDPTFIDPLEGTEIIFTGKPKGGGGGTEAGGTESEIFLVLEDMPKFQGGDASTFQKWVQSRLKYPQVAIENSISGRVTLSFVVEKDGSISNIEVLASPDKSLSEEAIRIIKTAPKWTPGKQRGAPARVRFNMPIEFVLN